MATILVVDSSEEDRQYLVAVLTNAGYRILEAHESSDALAAVQAGNPDLVMIDAVSAPDGFEFVGQLREGSTVHRAPILIYTALIHEETTRLFLAKYPGTSALLKPADPGVILDAVSRLLNAPLSIPTGPR